MQSLCEPVFCAPTLNEVWLSYQTYRELKKTTARDYAKRLRYVEDWRHMPLDLITRDMIEKRHKEISATGPQNANYVFRVVRALFIFAGCKFDELHGVNPVRRLSELRAWNKADPAKTSIELHDLPTFFNAVLMDENDTIRDIHLLWTLSGLRRNEGSTLTWERINLDAATLFIPKEIAKNGIALNLPTGKNLTRLLRARRADYPDAKWVFEGDSADVSLSETNKSYQRIAKRSGLKFSPHSLRRTFLTAADYCEVPLHIQKRLVNHKPKDITELYHCHSVERLRKPMQEVEDCILGFANVGF